MEDLLKVIKFYLLQEAEKGAGGQAPGKYELVDVKVEDAIDIAKGYCKKAGRTFEEVFVSEEKFSEGYLHAQNLAKRVGVTKREEMPVITSAQVKDFQERLNAGRIDVKPPYSELVKGKYFEGEPLPDPFPEGVPKEVVEKWFEAGIKDGAREDDVIKVTSELVEVRKLKPIQKEIFLDKTLEPIVKNGRDVSVKFYTSENNWAIVSEDYAIIDGHHRWLGECLIGLNMKIHVARVHKKIDELLKIAKVYGQALGNKPNLSAPSGENKQEKSEKEKEIRKEEINMEDIKRVIKRVLNEQTGTRVSVSTREYEFNMDTSVMFGKGRYAGSSLSGLAIPDWYWTLPEDDAIDGYFYYLSRSNLDVRNLIKQIEDNGVFNEIKKDLLKCSHYWLLRVMVNEQYDGLLDMIYSEIGDIYTSRMAEAQTRREKEALKREREEMYGYVKLENVKEMFENEICKDGRILNRINSEIRRIKSTKDLFFKWDDFEFDVWDYIWEHTEAYTEELRAKVQKELYK